VISEAGSVRVRSECQAFGCSTDSKSAPRQRRWRRCWACSYRRSQARCCLGCEPISIGTIRPSLVNVLSVRFATRLNGGSGVKSTFSRVQRSGGIGRDSLRSNQSLAVSFFCANWALTLRLRASASPTAICTGGAPAGIPILGTRRLGQPKVAGGHCGIDHWSLVQVQDRSAMLNANSSGAGAQCQAADVEDVGQAIVWQSFGSP